MPDPVYRLDDDIRLERFVDDAPPQSLRDVGQPGEQRLEHDPQRHIIG